MIYTTTNFKNYYQCKRCNIDSENEERMCPCPRGGCEATQTGTVILTKQICTGEHFEEAKEKMKNQ